jgi:hypothetical protein
MVCLSWLINKWNNNNNIIIIIIIIIRQDSSVNKVSVDAEWTTGVRFPTGWPFLSSPPKQDKLRGPPSLLSN